MGKRTVVVIIAILIIGAIAFGLARNNNQSNQTNNPPASNNQTSQNQNQNNTQTPTGTDSVSIQNFAFLPGDITIKKGTTVTWTNNDSTTHTVSEIDGKKGPGSGNLSPGDKYDFTFNEVGKFKYRCNIHTDMLGTVTVTD